MIPCRIGGLGQFLRTEFRGRFDFGASTASGVSAPSIVSFERPSLLQTTGYFFRATMPLLLILAFVSALLFHPPVATSHLGIGVGALFIGETQDVAKLLNEIQTAFASFRTSNDERFTEIKTKGFASADVVSNVEKSNKAVTDLTEQLKVVQAALKEVETAQARVALTGTPEEAKIDAKHARQFFGFTRGVLMETVTPKDLEDYRAYREAFNLYLRKGDAIQDARIRNALQTGQAPSGGFWVTPDTSGRMIEFLRQTSPIRQVADVQAIGTDTLEGSMDLDEASAGWVGETESRTETNTPAVYGPWKIPVFEQYANPRTTQKLLDDVNFDAEGWLAKKVADKFSRTENAAFCIGTGTSKPRGFTTYTAGTPAATSVALFSKIQQINSGASGAFASSNPGDKLIDIVHSVKAPLRQGAQWAMNNLTLAEVRKIKDGEGRYLLIPDFSNEGVTNRLLGYAIQEFYDMADMASASLSIAFANWKEAYQIVDHTVGIRTLRDPFTAKPYVQFYTTKRVGGGVLNFEAIKLMKFSA